LRMYGGIVGSMGAGPQRARTEVYDWNGSLYALKETTYDESDFLYFKVLDANAAFSAGDYTRAIALYQEAIDNEDLRAWRDWDDQGQQEKDDLRAFARYRLVVVYVLVNDLANAEAVAAAMDGKLYYYVNGSSVGPLPPVSFDSEALIPLSGAGYYNYLFYQLWVYSHL